MTVYFVALIYVSCFLVRGLPRVIIRLFILNFTHFLALVLFISISSHFLIPLTFVVAVAASVYNKIVRLDLSTAAVVYGRVLVVITGWGELLKMANSPPQ